MKLKTIFLGVLVLVVTLSFVSSEVGVGISPSKIVEQVEGGKTKQVQVLVFNTGDSDMELNAYLEGEIAEFGLVIPTNQVVSPEPKPHELPIKNGKIFIIEFNAPAVRDVRTYTGSISIIGSGTAGSTFGGSVGVTSKIELVVLPSKSFFSLIKPLYYLLAGIIILLIVIIWFLKKKGLNISFKNTKSK